jgi:hypothetical protein
MNIHDFITARKACKTTKERILLDIGREKDDLIKLAERALSDDIMLLRYADEHIRRIYGLKEYLRELESEEDPVEKYHKYLQPWEHACTQCPNDGMCTDCMHYEGICSSLDDPKDVFASYRETEEFRAHREQKLRHAKRRSFKIKRR